MRSIWLHRIGFVLAGVVTVGALLAGCGPQKLPLTLCAEPEIAHHDQDIIIALDNPAEITLFLPSAWTGLAVYRMLLPETWAEYHYPQGSPAMHTTSQKMIEYCIPAGTLEPGTYKLTLQGRTGEEGAPFSLEVNLTVSEPAEYGSPHHFPPGTPQTNILRFSGNTSVMFTFLHFILIIVVKPYGGGRLGAKI